MRFDYILRDGVVAVPASAPELPALRGKPLSIRRIGPGRLPRIPGAKSDEGRDLLPTAAAVEERIPTNSGGVGQQMLNDVAGWEYDSNGMKSIAGTWTRVISPTMGHNSRRGRE